MVNRKPNIFAMLIATYRTFSILFFKHGKIIGHSNAVLSPHAVTVEHIAEILWPSRISGTLLYQYFLSVFFIPFFCSSNSIISNFRIVLGKPFFVTIRTQVMGIVTAFWVAS